MPWRGSQVPYNSLHTASQEERDRRVCDKFYALNASYNIASNSSSDMNGADGYLYTEGMAQGSIPPMPPLSQQYSQPHQYHYNKPSPHPRLVPRESNPENRPRIANNVLGKTEHSSRGSRFNPQLAEEHGHTPVNTHQNPNPRFQHVPPLDIPQFSQGPQYAEPMVNGFSGLPNTKPYYGNGTGLEGNAGFDDRIYSGPLAGASGSGMQFPDFHYPPIRELLCDEESPHLPTPAVQQSSQPNKKRCITCEGDFANLGRHKREVHRQGNVEMYYCPAEDCERNKRGFPRKENFKSHMRTCKKHR
ncbi:hypothetical protein BZA77DRAFT_154206 [Pyronema omphalodes]|nr:hypothetical protein BZA77DRAFT_154206 [Pyronema omphalodes]